MCFFFNDTATTEIYTLSLHDALPILDLGERLTLRQARARAGFDVAEPPGELGRPAVYLRFPPAGGMVTYLYGRPGRDRKSTRLNSSHANISYAVFCLKKKKQLLMHSY